MKILFDSQIYDLQQFGGISRMYVDFHNEWKKNDDMTSSFSVERTDNVYLSKIHPYSYGRKNNLELSKRMIQNGDYDILYPTYFLTYFLPYLKGKPFVMSVHDMIPELYPQFFRWNDLQITGKRQMVKYASAIEVPTETTKRDLIRILGVEENKIHVIGRGIQDPFGETTLENNVADHNYVLYVGQRAAYKRFDWFIKHASPFFKKYPEIRLICTGNNFTTSELTLLRKYGMETKSTARRVNDTELATLYKNALLFVYTSEYEGFGLPVLESYKMNCVTLLNNNDCFNEVTKGKGIFFNLNENDSDITEIMEKHIHLNDEEKQTIINTQRQILSNYSLSKTVDKLNNMIRQVPCKTTTTTKITHKVIGSLIHHL